MDPDAHMVKMRQSGLAPLPSREPRGEAAVTRPGPHPPQTLAGAGLPDASISDSGPQDRDGMNLHGFKPPFTVLRHSTRRKLIRRGRNSVSSLASSPAGQAHPESPGGRHVLPVPTDVQRAGKGRNGGACDQRGWARVSPGRLEQVALSAEKGREAAARPPWSTWPLCG